MLPEGITESLLHGTDEDLAVILKNGDIVVSRFTILKDGTIVAAPLLEDLMSALQPRSSSSLPVVPIFVSPRK